MKIPDIEEVRQTVEGRFDVEALEAHGGMGAVFRGKHRSLDSPVAIKVLPILATLDPDQLARFRREAMTAAKLPHPNIVPVYEFEVQGDMAYLVMPLINGPSLQLWLRKHGTMTFGETWKLLTQVGSALQFAHDRDIIHRDIKPANILLDQETDRWMVADFGLARGVVPSKDSKLTGTGMIVGTPAYMPPEQATGGAVNERADLYALGSVVYECLTGKMFGLDQTRTTAETGLRDMGYSPSRAREITAPLEFDPQSRPASVEEWIATLTPRKGNKSKVVVGGAVSLVLAAVSVLLGTFLIGQRTLEAIEPVVAVLPVTLLSGRAPDAFPEGALQSMFEEQLRSVGQGLLSSQTLLSYAGVTGGAPVPDEDSLTAISVVKGATTVFAPTAEFLADSSVRLRARVGAPGGDVVTYEVTGALDSVTVLVASLVVEAFAQDLQEQAGFNEALPRDYPTAVTFLNGRRLFHQAAYHEAFDLFHDVIDADSTFAPAYFWAMFSEIMRTRPTRATHAPRSALDAALRYSDRLPPNDKALLDAYHVLVAEGDVLGAYTAFADHAEQNPTSADAWFMKGYLEFYFAALLRNKQRQARTALQRASELDPGFAAPYAILGWLAMAGERPNRPLAQSNFQSYLSIDSTSVWAGLIRMVDSAVFSGQGLAIRGSLDYRPVEALELVALAGGALDVTKVNRELTDRAIVALAKQATTPEQKRMVFRMESARLFAERRLADIANLRRGARANGTPRQELDHWALLPVVTGLLPRPETDTLTEVALRLLENDDPISLWLAARWMGDEPAGRRARVALQDYDGEELAILANSLRGDLEAMDLVAAGDSSAALATWRNATNRHQVETVFFGLVGSLWPLQLERARVAFAMGLHDEVLEATAQFEQTVGFMDQAAWLDGLRLRANAFRARDNTEIPDARRARSCLAYVLGNANGAGVAEYEAVTAEWGVDGSPTCVLP